MHALISGLVQGVGFRYTTFCHAKKLQLVGTVRNLSDGKVEIIAQGSKEKLEELLHLLKTQGGASKIEDVQAFFSSIQTPFIEFKISN